MSQESKLTVLVLDDEPENLKVLERALRNEYQLLTSTSPVEAVELLRSHSIDVVIADHRMPGMSGVEFLERAAQIAPNASRVLVTAYAEIEILASAINRASVHQFIAKPFSAQQVREMLRALPHRREASLQVVVVSPDASSMQPLVAMLQVLGHSTAELTDTGAATEMLALPEVGAVLVDLDCGVDAVVRIILGVRSRHRPAPVIVLCDAARADEGMRLVRLGAHDVLLRPFRNDEVALRVGRAVESRRMRSEVHELRAQLQETYSYRELIGGSAKMREVYDVIERVADTDSTILLRGETGTGKELVARVIHQVSRRRSGPFVAVNCGAIPEALFESELFGHERGAFTGAVARKIGRFEMANGGTLFLDELGDLPLIVQVKLLRAIQEREIERVGGGQPVKVDLRLIGATGTDLEAAVRDGRFRQDLFYRVNVLPVTLPPLRERREDIRLLALHYLELFEKRLGKAGIIFAKSAIEALEAHDWPGNVRELANVIERALAMARSGGVLSAEAFDLVRASNSPATAPLAVGEDSQSDTPVAKIKDAVEQLERNLIAAALSSSGGNQTHAARALGITRQGLAQKMTKYGIQPMP